MKSAFVALCLLFGCYQHHRSESAPSVEADAAVQPDAARPGRSSDSGRPAEDSSRPPDPPDPGGTPGGCVDEMVVEASWPFEGEELQAANSYDVTTVPLVANLDGEGSAELIFVTHLPSPHPQVEEVLPQDLRAQLRVVNLDHHRTTTLPVARHVALDRFATPAVGDIDGDGQLEIVVLGRHSHPERGGYAQPIGAFRPDGSVVWIQTDRRDSVSFGYGGAAVTLGDLDRDGIVEVIVAIGLRRPHRRTGLDRRTHP